MNQAASEGGDGKTALSKPSFKNTLSAGDRTTRALALFLAHLERDPDRANAKSTGSRPEGRCARLCEFRMLLACVPQSDAGSRLRDIALVIRADDTNLGIP